ncbi:hypothetical protein LY624_20870 [Pseudoalteromonas sp. N1230-9]|uniref:hypothetical protein n=1 Tax=Pseudoalteromonas sp. N1230-9 TaxID=2907156 RepID=UPI002B309056|nr:hypothetical protein LY624_20870 [Pseudoalteromonas sp. N1230-9]
MIKSKFSSIFIALPICFIASCSASQNESAVIFKCHADKPTPIDVVVSEHDGNYKLMQFNTAQVKLTEMTSISDASKSSYHRSLVNEHSMTFTHNGNKITVSDYHSEELGMITKEKSVTIEHDAKKDYWLCDDSSVSKLPSIENF